MKIVFLIVVLGFCLFMAGREKGKKECYKELYDVYFYSKDIFEMASKFEDWLYDNE